MKVKSIKDILGPKTVFVSPETMAEEAISIMGENKTSCVLVIQDRRPVGIFTERDVISTVRKNICLDDTRIKELMSSPVTTTRDNVDILEAYNIILTDEIRQLAIVDSKGNAIGVVTQTDIINSLGPEFFIIFNNISKIMSKVVVTVEAGHTVMDAVNRMNGNNTSCIIVDDNGRPVGVLTERDVTRLLQEQVDLEELKIEDAMNSPVYTICKDDQIQDAVMIMKKKNVRRLTVVGKDNKLEGILTQFDIIKGSEPAHIKYLKAAIYEKNNRLRDSEEKYRKLTETAQDAIICIDEKGIINVWNQLAENVFGYTKSEIIGKPITTIIPERYKKKHLNGIRRFLKTGKTKIIGKTVEVSGKTKEGGDVPIEMSLSFHETGKKQYTFTAIIRDITDRKKREEEFHKLSCAVEQSPTSVMVTDFEGNIEYVNPKFTELTGYTLEEALGQNPRILKSGKTKLEEYKHLWETIKSGSEWRGEFCNKKKNNKLYWEYSRISPVKNDKGIITHFVAVNEDTTERKKAEEEIRKAKDEAEAANQAKSEFLANMSHEIRTPMNGVIGMTGLLLETELTSQQSEYLQTVRHSAEALMDIINDILDYSKIEAGKLNIEPIPFDLLIATQEVTELIATRAREKKIEVLLSYTPNTPRYVIGDPGRIRQILINLTSNAIKFTHEGHILINVVCEKTTKREAKLRLTVEDTGIGIPGNRLDTIFDKFTQAKASTTRKYGGTGLGLSISKQLVEMMGGEIGVSSSQGKGSTFWFTLSLPLSKEGVTVPVPDDDLADVKVMVVDNNMASYRVLHEILSEWRMQINGYKSGEKALTALQKAYSAGDPYQIAIIDHHIPGMDGEKLGQAIKNDPHLQDTILAMLTYAGERGDAMRLEQAGFEAYLTKPIRQLEIVDFLKIIWNAKKQGIDIGMVTRHNKAGPHTPKKILSERAKPSFIPRVLVAEDNIVNQKVAVQMLKKLGCYVDVAANGNEAVEMLMQLSYDLVFMDCQMPGMDGYEATREIRRMKKNKHIPIIAMTAHVAKGERERCLNAGMDDYLSKPVEKEDLENTLKRWTSKLRTEKRENKKSLKADEVASVPIFDPSRFMNAVDGNISFAKEILDSFLDETPKKIYKLHEALSSENLQMVECHAHAMKGAATTIGAGRFKEIAGKLELEGKAGNMDKARTLSKELDISFQTLKDTLDRFDWEKV